MAIPVAIVLVAAMLALWAWQNGQFRDMDEARYLSLKERAPAPWPGRQHPEDREPDWRAEG